ncbi:MAG TPA: hypothetical protein VMY59_10045 [Candidatus Thermoplasmatota archaeon]|jgi:hypothetical protein|nr:hypothetical protein [Candidatus Thermoplasmatota archaeon]
MRMNDMTTKGIKIWIWAQNNRILKAISNKETGTISIYDEYDNIILRRTGLTKQQVKTIELIFATYALKKVGDRKEPFTYL